MVQEFECVCCLHNACISHYLNTTVMVEGWGNIPGLDGMVPPFVPFAWFHMDHAFSTNGAMGVASKENIPSMASWAERFGFWVQWCIMLRLMSVCSRSLHQFDRQ